MWYHPAFCRHFWLNNHLLFLMGPKTIFSRQFETNFLIMYAHIFWPLRNYAKRLWTGLTSKWFFWCHYSLLQAPIITLQKLHLRIFAMFLIKRYCYQRWYSHTLFVDISDRNAWIVSLILVDNQTIVHNCELSIILKYYCSNLIKITWDPIQKWVVLLSCDM